jgi:integrase
LNKNKGVVRTLADGTKKEYPRSPAIKRPSMTVAKAIELYELSPEWNNLANATREQYKVYLALFHRIYGPAALREIQTEDLLAVRDRQRMETRARKGSLPGEIGGDGAAFGVCSAVESFFQFCKKRNMVTTSPAIGLRDGLHKGTLATWTEEHLRVALAKLPFHLARAVELAVNTGLRRGDLVGMKWSQFTVRGIECLGENRIGKTKVEVIIPLKPEFRATMESWRTEGRGDLVLLTRDGKPIGAATLTSSLSRALKRIGLPKNINIHGVRKLVCTRLAEAGCSVYQMMSITGHKNPNSLAPYVQAVNQLTLATEAMSKLVLSQNRENARIR